MAPWCLLATCPIFGMCVVGAPLFWLIPFHIRAKTNNISLLTMIFLDDPFPWFLSSRCLLGCIHVEERLVGLAPSTAILRRTAILPGITISIWQFRVGSSGFLLDRSKKKHIQPSSFLGGLSENCYHATNSRALETLVLKCGLSTTVYEVVPHTKLSWFVNRKKLYGLW